MTQKKAFIILCVPAGSLGKCGCCVSSDGVLLLCLIVTLWICFFCLGLEHKKWPKMFGLLFEQPSVGQSGAREIQSFSTKLKQITTKCLTLHKSGPSSGWWPDLVLTKRRSRTRSATPGLLWDKSVKPRSCNRHGCWAR
ncbi:hypothetical protein Ancab_006103 [Ancistrocladus abbreviatus]